MKNSMSKFWMLANRVTSQMYERDRFIKVAEDMGINFTVVFADEVDLLFNGSGYKICEANSAPGFEGFERATGINVPEKIFKYAGIRI